jgi:hypothetical protein
MLFGSEQGPDLASLYANAPAYHAIVDLISSDIAELRAEMEAAGRPTYEVDRAGERAAPSMCAGCRQTPRGSGLWA